MDARRFRATMVLNGDSVSTVAAALSRSRNTVYLKIKGKLDFDSREIQILKERWSLSANDIELIFFSPKVS
jgi:hypothetical protein